MATLAHFGWRLSEVKEELSNLTYSNYVSGPEIDRAEPKSDNLWIFKSYIDRTPIYIKLKVKYQTDSRVFSYFGSLAITFQTKIKKGRSFQGGSL